MTSLWLEASRDAEEEHHALDLGVAKMATANLWPFLALAQTEREFEHRLALTMDQIEARVAHEILRDEVVSSFREDYGIYAEARAAAEAAEAAAEPMQFFHEASGQWITVQSAADETPGNPYYPSGEQEQGPETGQTGTYPQHPTGGDPVNPMQGEFPMQPSQWQEQPDFWVNRPMNFGPYQNPGNTKSAAVGYEDEGVQTGTGPNPFYFAGGEEGAAGDQQAGFPADVSLPEANERVDYFGAVPPVQSTGTEGDGHSYSNENGLNTKEARGGYVTTPDPNEVADRKRSNVGACYDCNRPVYRHGNEWKHLEGDQDHHPRLPGDHPWVQERMQRLHYSGARKPLQKGEYVKVLHDHHDPDMGIDVPAGYVGKVDHVTEPGDDANGDIWVGVKHRDSEVGHTYIAPENLRRAPAPAPPGSAKPKRQTTNPFGPGYYAAKTADYQYVKPNPDGEGWVVTQKGTGKVLSHHDSEEKAKASFRAMEMSKHSSFGDREAAAHYADASSTDTGPNPGDSTGGSSTPTPPPSMQQGGPGAEAMPPMQPMTIPNPSVSSSPFPNSPAGGGGAGAGMGAGMAAPNPFQGVYRVAEQTRDRPDMFNPTGVGDEFNERTWEGQINQAPRQRMEDRNVNTPQRAQEPIRQTTSDGGGLRPQQQDEEDED